MDPNRLAAIKALKPMTDTEITRFLAEKCMGYRVCESSFHPAWNPLSSISDAFQVVEKMRDFNLAVDIRGPVKHHADWSIEFFPWDGAGKVFHGHSDTCARAICLAAIAALEGK